MLADRVVRGIPEDNAPDIVLSLITGVTDALHKVALDSEEDTPSGLFWITVLNRSGHDRLPQASDQRRLQPARGSRGELAQAVEHRRQPRPQCHDDMDLGVDLGLSGVPLGLLAAEHGAITLVDCAFAGQDSCLEKPHGDEPVGSGSADQNGCADDTEEDVTQMIRAALVRQYTEHGAACGAQKREGTQGEGLGTGCPRYHPRCFPPGSKGTGSSFARKPQPEH